MDLEWRIAGGGQIDSDSHGMVDVAVRSVTEREAFSDTVTLSLYTETLDLRWERSSPIGRAWVAPRAQLGAAGMFITPWTNGAPDPTRAAAAFYGGIDSGTVAYGPGGTYLGAESVLRYWTFLPRESTLRTPASTPVAEFTALLGIYRPAFNAELRPGWTTVGTGLDGAAHSGPRATLRAEARPGRRFGALVQLNAGVLADPNAIAAFRIGGLTPYAIPYAGAAWAEWWVDRYAALRLGPRASFGDVWRVDLAVVADGVRARSLYGSDPDGIGLGMLSRVQHRRFYAELSLGYGLGLPRQAGVSPASAWFTLGLDWPKRR